MRIFNCAITQEQCSACPLATIGGIDRISTYNVLDHAVTERRNGAMSGIGLHEVARIAVESYRGMAKLDPGIIETALARILVGSCENKLGSNE